MNARTSVNKLDVPALHAEVIAMRQLIDKERRQAENDFIAKYGPIFMGARLYWWTGEDFDPREQEQAVMEALLRSLRTWQPGMGRGFKSWVAWGMRNALKVELRRSRLVRGEKDNRHLSWTEVDRQECDDDDNATIIPAAQIAALQADAPLADVREKQARLAALDALTPVERRCLTMVFNVPGVDADVDVSGMAAAEREAIARKALKRLRAAVD